MHTCSGELAVDVSVLALEQATVGGSQVSVEEGIDKGVDQRVRISQPEKCPLDPQGDAATDGAADERPGSREEEEGQPAHGEGSNDDPQGSRSFLFPLEDRDVSSFMLEEFGDVGALLHILGHLSNALQGDATLRLLQPGEARESVPGSALAGSLVDLVIHEEHDGHRDVERHSSRVNRVAEILADQTHLVVVDILGPAEEGRQSDRSREQPDSDDDLCHAFSVLSHRVGQGSCDSEVPERHKKKPRGQGCDHNHQEVPPDGH